MMVSRHWSSMPLLALASGCAVAGPIYDRSYEKAPFAACADLTGAGGRSIGQQPVRLGCFEAVARTFSAGQQIAGVEHQVTDAAVRLTDAAAFRLAAADGCSGQFTNFVIEYAAPAGASATVMATDSLGRHLGAGRIDAKPSAKARRLIIRDMGDPLKNPTIAEFSDVQGELLVRSLCLKGY